MAAAQGGGLGEAYNPWGEGASHLKSRHGGGVAEAHVARSEGLGVPEWQSRQVVGVNSCSLWDPAACGF